MLDKIRSCGRKTGIVSNCTAEEVSGLQSSRLMTFFYTAVLSCDVGHAKPEPEIYKICMNRLGEASEESFSSATVNMNCMVRKTLILSGHRPFGIEKNIKSNR